MTTHGFDRPLYILPFGHRGSFETGMFGWKGALTREQTAQIGEFVETFESARVRTSAA
jgi:5-dehydro-2-deoxygluconokinase